MDKREEELRELCWVIYGYVGVLEFDKNCSLSMSQECKDKFDMQTVQLKKELWAITKEQGKSVLKIKPSNHEQI